MGAQKGILHTIKKSHGTALLINDNWSTSQGLKRQVYLAVHRYHRRFACEWCKHCRIWPAKAGWRTEELADLSAALEPKEFAAERVLELAAEWVLELGAPPVYCLPWADFRVLVEDSLEHWKKAVVSVKLVEVADIRPDRMVWDSKSEFKKKLLGQLKKITWIKKI